MNEPEIIRPKDIFPISESIFNGILELIKEYWPYIIIAIIVIFIVWVVFKKKGRG